MSPVHHSQVRKLKYLALALTQNHKLGVVDFFFFLSIFLCNPISTSGFEVATKKKKQKPEKAREEREMHAHMHAFHSVSLAHSFSIPYLCLYLGQQPFPMAPFVSVSVKYIGVEDWGLRIEKEFVLARICPWRGQLSPLLSLHFSTCIFFCIVCVTSLHLELTDIHHPFELIMNDGLCWRNTQLWSKKRRISGNVNR